MSDDYKSDGPFLTAMEHIDDHGVTSPALFDAFYDDAVLAGLISLPVKSETHELLMIRMPHGHHHPYFDSVNLTVSLRNVESVWDRLNLYAEENDLEFHIVYNLSPQLVLDIIKEAETNGSLLRNPDAAVAMRCLEEHLKEPSHWPFSQNQRLETPQIEDHPILEASNPRVASLDDARKRRSDRSKSPAGLVL